MVVKSLVNSYTLNASHTNKKRAWIWRREEKRKERLIEDIRAKDKLVRDRIMSFSLLSFPLGLALLSFFLFYPQRSYYQATA